MRIFTTARKVSPEVPMSFFNFERFEKQCGNFLFIDARINFKPIKEIKNEKLVYFEIEEPNRFNSSDLDFRREEYEWCFYKILSVCPYTTEWLNKSQGKERRQFVFFPFNENLIPPPAEKLYDVIYCGPITAREVLDIVKTLSKFNYRFVAPSEDILFGVIKKLRIVRKIKKILKIPPRRERYLTNKDVTNQEKLKLISQSRVTIVHNILFEDVLAVWQIQKMPDFEDNGAFALIPKRNILRSILDFILCKEYIVPQQKTRLFEAALCRSLILCRRDPFNIVERFFVPGKEFVYYEEDKLEETLRDILNHYEDYSGIIENAYQKASRNYTTKAFFEKYLKNLS